MVRTNILITGSDGQLGKSIRNNSTEYDYNYFFMNKNELDITDFQSLENHFV